MGPSLNRHRTAAEPPSNRCWTIGFGASRFEGRRPAEGLARELPGRWTISVAL